MRKEVASKLYSDVRFLTSLNTVHIKKICITLALQCECRSYLLLRYRRNYISFAPRPKIPRGPVLRGLHLRQDLQTVLPLLQRRSQLQWTCWLKKRNTSMYLFKQCLCLAGHNTVATVLYAHAKKPIKNVNLASLRRSLLF